MGNFFSAVTPDAWIQAAGSVVGVILTIVATLVIGQNWRARSDKRKIRARLSRILSLAQDMRCDISSDMNDDSSSWSVATQKGMLRSLRQMRFLMGRADINDPGQWQALDELAAVMQRHEAELVRELENVNYVGVTPLEFETNHQRVCEMYEDIADATEMAIQVFDGQYAAPVT